MFQIFVPCVFIYLNFAFVCTSSSSTATLSFCYSFLFFSRFLALLYHLAFVLPCVVCNWVLDLVCQTLTVTKIWYSVTSHFFQRVWPSRETLFGRSGQEVLYRSWWAVGTLHGGLCHLGMNYMKCCKALWVIGRLEMGYINASPFTILFNIFLWSQSLDYIYYMSLETPGCDLFLDCLAEASCDNKVIFLIYSFYMLYFFCHLKQTNIDFLCVSFIMSLCRHYIETNNLLHFITVIIKNTTSPTNE